MFFKKIFASAAIFVFAAALLAPLTAGAQQSKIPELNPVCWKEKECQDARKSTFGQDSKTNEGWVKNQELCPGSDWGMCLPAGTSKTAISFGGRKEFANMGEFITIIYKYALQIAAIVAVVMIIIAGVQWTTSGGSSERITASKKRIFGAVVGLFIAYMSYFILNTINPATVSLRLPQTFMIKQQTITPQFCDGLPKNTEFALAGASVDKVDPKKVAGATFKSMLETEMVCNKKFFPKNGGGNTCEGYYCGPKNADRLQMCLKNIGGLIEVDFLKEKTEGNSACVNANIAGFITMPDNWTGCAVGAGKTLIGGGGSGWTFPYVIEDRALYDGLWVVCEDGGIGAVEGENGDLKLVPSRDGKFQGYSLSLSISQVEQRAKEVCKVIKGYGLLLRFNHACITNQDQFHLIGKGGVDLVGWGYRAQKAMVEAENFNPLIEKMPNISAGSLMQLEDLKSGIRVNIDAGNVSNEEIL